MGKKCNSGAIGAQGLQCDLFEVEMFCSVLVLCPCVHCVMCGTQLGTVFFFVAFVLILLGTERVYMHSFQRRRETICLLAFLATRFVQLYSGPHCVRVLGHDGHTCRHDFATC